ncbi:MAG: signal recognition particle protein [Bacillota bacterium]
MFEQLARKIQEALKFLSNRGKLSEKDLDDALRLIRLSLLEADVNYKVVKDFIQRAREKALGKEVLESLTPGQMVVKIVRDELVSLMGGTNQGLSYSVQSPLVVMIIGLQGSGKTTTCAKLARLLKQSGKRPLLVAADIYRPAAVDQLKILAERLDVLFYESRRKAPPQIASEGLNEARRKAADTVIIDTAGRLHIDGEMLSELQEIANNVNPGEILLVADAMTGQDAVAVAQGFQSVLNLTGVILTKVDSDARGGAALSMRSTLEKPIKYIGVGEKLEALEPFHPERMASRILGMGDILTLIEKAETAMNAEQSKKIARKLSRADFTLEDFLDQLEQMKKMGPLEDLLKIIPVLPGNDLAALKVDEKDLVRLEAIIRSMTPGERANPQIINASRRERIARGSGTSIQDINRLLNRFEQSRKMIKEFAGISKKSGKKRPFPF